MKPHCPRCNEIIEQVSKALENLYSDDETENLAGLIWLRMIVDPDYEPTGDGIWTKTESEAST